jgi:hypothetical protein
VVPSTQTGNDEAPCRIQKRFGRGFSLREVAPTVSQTSPYFTQLAGEVLMVFLGSLTPKPRRIRIPTSLLGHTAQRGQRTDAF